ncbi:hypothetical protein ACHAW6_009009 [Cyclotella cf. meneghiniana]
MNTLTTIEGRVVDAETTAKPPKPKRSLVLGRRALSAGRGSRVPPSYEEPERVIPNSPKKFAQKISEGADRSTRAEKMSAGAGAQTNTESYSDTREETEPPKKNVLARQESFPDDATRDDASINGRSFEAANGARSDRKYIERAASAGRAMSTGRERFHIEYRPRYRDQNAKYSGKGSRRYEAASPADETIDVIETNRQFVRHVSIDSSEFASHQNVACSTKNMITPARNVQAGIRGTASGLTVPSPTAFHATSTGRDWKDIPSMRPPSASPRNLPQRGVDVTRSTSSPSIVTPSTTPSASSSFLTPKTQFHKRNSSAYSLYCEEGEYSEATDPGENSFAQNNPELVDDGNWSSIHNYDSHPMQNRKEQARHRLKKYFDDIDSRVKGRRSYEAQTPEMPLKPLLDGVSVENQYKLVVPPLIDEDGVWRDRSLHSVFRASPTSMGTVNTDFGPLGADSVQDDGFVKSLQSRVEYYKTCLKSNEKKLDELIESEKELKQLLMSQQEQYEIHQKRDSELHEKEMEEVKSAMNEAKKAIDALEATIEKLREASKEKDDCIHDLKGKLNEVEEELKDCITANKERVKVYDANVIELQTNLSERDSKISIMEEKIKKLEEESAKMTDLCSRTEAAFVDSCKTIKEKEVLLINIKEHMEQEKDHLLYNFEKYREDFTDKMEKTSLRMEAITTEKNKLIESLHSKVQLLESSLMEKEEEAKQHAHCAEKHDELNSKIQTLALALAEKDKELSNCQRELNKERKLHAESNEQRIHAENELSYCQEELSNVKRAQAEDNERRHNAKKIAKALSSNVATTTRRRHHAIPREPRQDPPVSPHRNHIIHPSVYYEREQRTKSPRDRHSRRSETEKYDNRSMSSIEYDSSDSIFNFSH